MTKKTPHTTRKLFRTIVLILAFLTSPLLLCSGSQLLSLLGADVGLTFFASKLQIENKTSETLYLTPITTTYGEPRVITQSNSIRQRDFPLEAGHSFILTYDSADAPLAGVIVCRTEEDCRLLNNNSVVFDSNIEAYTQSIDAYEDLPALEADWLQAKQAHPQNSFRVVVMSMVGLLPILLFILWLFFRK